MASQSRRPDDASKLRNVLVENLIRQGVINTHVVQQAFRAVPRHLFVPGVDIATAYSNKPIFIRLEAGRPVSSSTQPTMMAIMIEQLRLERGMRVLEIGTGTGYNAAILAHIVGEEGRVVTVDIDKDIVAEATKKLANAGYSRVQTACWDGFHGFPLSEPYDRIVVTVGALDVSPHWVHQLNDGGLLVVPIWFRGFNLSVALEKRHDELQGLSASPCTFIPIRGAWKRTEGMYQIGDPPNRLLQMIALEWDNQLDLRNLHRLFSQDAELREIGRSLEGQFFSQNLSSGLYMCLTVNPRVFILSSSQHNPFQGISHGLIDLDTMSATMLTDTYLQQAIIYGNNATYGQMIELLDLWDGLGHPSIQNLKIRALFSPPNFIPEGSWIIPKKSAYTWVLSWGEGRRLWPPRDR